MGEHDEGEADQRQLQDGCGEPRPHQRGIAAMGAVERHEELVERHAGGEDQGEMSEFGNHCSALFPSFTPFSFRLSASSRGM